MGVEHRIEADAAPASATPVVPRWVGFALGGGALAVLPWAAWILWALPDRQVAAHWALAWSGFDVGLAATLAATAVAVLRRSAMTGPIAAAAGTLLICDAWFDCVTAHGAGQFVMSLTLALAVELPAALVCMWIARHAGAARPDMPPVARRMPARRGFLRGARGQSEARADGLDA